MSAHTPRSSSPASVQPDPHSQTDWMATSVDAARLIATTGEVLPFPYVKGVLGIAVTLLETVQKVKKNRDELAELCEEIIKIMEILKEVSKHGERVATEFKTLCEDFHICLQDVLNAVQPSQQHRGIRGRFKEMLTVSSTTDQITHYQGKIEKLHQRFMMQALICLNIRQDQPIQTITQRLRNCPPPSKNFQGRQIILDQMHQYIKNDPSKQKIFLLHGLGGTGKTQIARKFIAESSIQFSDIILVDASSAETLESSFKKAARDKHIGSTTPEILQWLSCNPDWLLLFDSADDRKLNLNKFFPQCSHGNIVITSRNRELRVHTGSHCLVSDLEETDAIQLLLKSAVQVITPTNVQIAAGIVKELCYLPLAVIQAGAFISKSGALDNYLDLYHKHRARLLSEAPTQTHDDYAWTVYTTWKISFDKLSPPAARLLQLCSFLHHQKISEQLFSNASTYQPNSYGPTKEELKEPCKFLSHFRDPDGIWDSLLFMDITNELQAYSLIDFDPQTKMFSIHALVHAWSQSTMVDSKIYRACMQAILGMNTSAMDPDVADKAVLAYPHLEFLLPDKMDMIPDFNIEYGLLCSNAGRFTQAERYLAAALEKQEALLGTDHPDTLWAMNYLAVAHLALNQLKEAKKLQLVVVQKGRELVGEDNPAMHIAMSNLASIYLTMGCFKEAEELQAPILKKVEKLPEEYRLEVNLKEIMALTYIRLGQFEKAQKLQFAVIETYKKLHGEDHPRTLRAAATMGYIIGNLGHLDEAAMLQVSNLAKQKKLLGEDHLDTLTSMWHLAWIYHKLDQLKEGEEIAVTLFEKRKQIFGEDDRLIVDDMELLASIYRDMGKLEKAAELQFHVLEKREKMLPEHHPDIMYAMGNLACTYCKLDRLKEAEELAVLALEKRKSISIQNAFREIQRLRLPYQKLSNSNKAASLTALVDSGVTQETFV